MDAWKIQRDRSKCCETGNLATAEYYFAVLELPDCVRRDLCMTCFQKLEQASEMAPVFWKCRRKQRTDTGPVLDLTALRMLFDRLGAVEEERAQGLRYFVALLLLRKRVLKMVDARNEEEERADLVVVDPKVEGMEPVALIAPELDAERLENLETELVEALGDGPADDGEGEASDDAPAAGEAPSQAGSEG